MNRIQATALLLLGGALAAPAGAHFYSSPNSCGPGSVTQVRLSYTFPMTNATRTFDAEIYEPRNPPRRAKKAAVIWSHGGGFGGVAPMRDFAQTTAEACYVSVSLGHTAWDQDLQDQFCSGQPLMDCLSVMQRIFKALDISRMVSEIEARYGPIPIAVGGHSGGSLATMTVAGAVRHLGGGIMAGPGEALSFEDPRPEAFIALSPSGPSYSGFFGESFLKPATSWDAIKRPMLTSTGAGDNKCSTHPVDCLEEKTPWNRQAPHRYMPGRRAGAGAKYQLYIDDVNTFHDIFRLSDSKCSSQGGAVPQAKCDDIHRHLRAVVLAFVDAELRGLGRARGYLASNSIKHASGDLAVRWRRK